MHEPRRHASARERTTTHQATPAGPQRQQLQTVQQSLIRVPAGGAVWCLLRPSRTAPSPAQKAGEYPLSLKQIRSLPPPLESFTRPHPPSHSQASLHITSRTDMRMTKAATAALNAWRLCTSVIVARPCCARWPCRRSRARTPSDQSSKTSRSKTSRPFAGCAFVPGCVRRLRAVRRSFVDPPAERRGGPCAAPSGFGTNCD